MAVRASDVLWKAGGGYYDDLAPGIGAGPVRPDMNRPLVRKLAALLGDFGERPRRPAALEVGCGPAAWSVWLAQRTGCRVVGVDIEPFAAELGRTNLAAARVDGEILCRDAFTPEANRDLWAQFDLVFSMGVLEHFDDPVERLCALGQYLKVGGHIVTTVPNLHGVNWWLQRLADVERLQMHVVYNATQLRDAHERAGFFTEGAGLLGFYDGFLSAPGVGASPRRRRAHRWLCLATNLAAAGWTRLCGERVLPERRWLAPHVFYRGRK
ncbi:MAG: class I SAM-dependent methyltransferase [Candidatus Schekmanbacteria bacterium]|nr:class I SAM-dependent methyltransferase [Candidatus Schekmanbacteria bacterium]